MVFVPVDPTAVAEAIKLARTTRCAVWVGSDGVTEDEFAALGREGLKITRFAYPLGTSTVEELDEALGMVELHHPGEAIWVQHRPGTLR